MTQYEMLEYIREVIEGREGRSDAEDKQVDTVLQWIESLKKDIAKESA